MKTIDVLRTFDKLKMKIREGRDTLAFFHYEDQLVLWTKVPHQRGELKGKLPYYIRQQLKLTSTQFRQLIQCKIGRAEYIQILKDKRII